MWHGVLLTHVVINPVGTILLFVVGGLAKFIFLAWQVDEAKFIFLVAKFILIVEVT